MSQNILGIICVVVGILSLSEAKRIVPEKAEEKQDYLKKWKIPPSARKANMRFGGICILIVGFILILF